MSQAKVDRYKEQKANRKEIMKKAKRRALIGKCAGAIVGLAVVVWVGYSGYDKFIVNAPKKSITVDYSAMEDYLESLTPEEEHDHAEETE